MEQKYLKISSYSIFFHYIFGTQTNLEYILQDRLSFKTENKDDDIQK